jgi:hypothetical protein
LPGKSPVNEFIKGTKIYDSSLKKIVDFDFQRTEENY